MRVYSRLPSCTVCALLYRVDDDISLTIVPAILWGTGHFFFNRPLSSQRFHTVFGSSLNRVSPFLLFENGVCPVDFLFYNTASCRLFLISRNRFNVPSVSFYSLAVPERIFCGRPLSAQAACGVACICVKSWYALHLGGGMSSLWGGHDFL